MKRIAIQQLAMQAVWLACVMGGASGMPLIGVVAAAGWIARHLRAHEAPGSQLLLVLCAAVVGSLADQALIRGAGLVYSGDAAGGLGPVWILALWMAFATSVDVSFRWLRGRLWLAAGLGSAGGSLAYRGGRELGAVCFDTTDPQVWLVLAIVWGVAVPTLVRMGELCERPDRVWAARG